MSHSYSGGRDGVVCAWDLHLDLKQHANGPSASDSKPKPATSKFRASTQAHTHWVNDIVLASNNTALVSASSDLTVKVWRPSSTDTEAHTIGQHADYVKSVASPSWADWVASGGLDRKICLWDLSGKGKSLEIDVSGEDVTEKGSVYALSVGRSILASGGPESIVRLWDPKTGKRVTKFVGHTDNIRAILVSESGDTVMTASSDQTVKVWSVTAGRCMHTLTMHNDSVWSLFSDHPELAVFYSSDRSGLLVKTDTRGAQDMDEGISVAIAQEHNGVEERGYRPRCSASQGFQRITGREPRGKIETRFYIIAFPPQIASAVEANPTGTSRRGSEIDIDSIAQATEPIHQLPEETIEGQNGLVKHKLLNDRRRVLTLDTAGDVLLWDLIRCEVIQRFGKRHLEDVEPEVNTLEAVAPWCSIDTSSGNLTVILEPFNCFDAEMYADELTLEAPVEFREDQRINLGRWILRYLFAKLIDEEIKRDEAYRQQLNENVEKRQAAARVDPPNSIAIPTSSGWQAIDSPVTTPKANGISFPMTPGLGIAAATPISHLPGVPENFPTPSSPIGKRSTQLSRPSGEDYFSNGINSVEACAKPATTPAAVETPTAKEETPQSPIDGKAKEKEKEKDALKSPTTPFSKKFRMGMSFGSKKSGRSASTSTEKPTIVEERSDENKSESSSNHEKEFDDNFRGVIQKIQNEYEKQLQESPDKSVETRVTPSLPVDTPVLKLPPGTRVIIQEETSGGSANLYQGTVETVGVDADIIEEKAPMWLGEVLLTNTIPPKDPVKISFVLHPWQDTLPSIAATDGNSRLNANRMLRVKKILAYVAERIDPTYSEDDTDALRPEEYLELYCNEQLLPNTMSLATLRAHIWKGGNDVVLYYKANGRKELPKELPQPPAAEKSSVAHVEDASVSTPSHFATAAIVAS
ncbi:hypothetical protein DL764_002995 [Monosporascus ibericus]|uniref:Uncharacterized protein n=1 Tax=Monosporascus ibericus TaxID=155417 RepID=A0A4Q4TMY4_9PEZI|nr:hypothetical protein DL764_002995 [Monosporascus ibericus]